MMDAAVSPSSQPPNSEKHFSAAAAAAGALTSTTIKPLTIKISSSSTSSSLVAESTGGGNIETAPLSDLSPPPTSDLLSPSFKSSVESSPYNSPSLISPPSSAFVSALQSPYISPRLLLSNHHHPLPPPIVSSDDQKQQQYVVTHPSPSPPVSYSCGSLSDDIPSTSYTPPPEMYDFCLENPTDEKLKLVTCVQTEPLLPPRISFTFPVPRISFAKAAAGGGGGSLSPSSNNNTTKLRSCDVYIGFHGQNPNLVTFR